MFAFNLENFTLSKASSTNIRYDANMQINFNKHSLYKRPRQTSTPLQHRCKNTYVVCTSKPYFLKTEFLEVQTPDFANLFGFFAKF